MCGRRTIAAFCLCIAVFLSTGFRAQANVSITRLRDIEHGRANASMDTLKSIADVLGVALPVLFIYSLEPAEVLEMLHRAQPETLTAG